MNRFAKYCWGVLVYNIAVVLWGAFVRATGSGAGCGSHWPTCNGEIIPRPESVETLIEFTHRATSGIALLAVLALFVWAFRTYPRRHIVRLGASLSLFFINIELAGAVVDGAGAGGSARLEQHQVGKSGLADGTVTHQHNVADLLGLVLRHVSLHVSEG